MASSAEEIMYHMVAVATIRMNINLQKSRSADRLRLACPGADAGEGDDACTSTMLFSFQL